MPGAPDIRTLQMVGRRLERLFLLGFVLVLLSFLQLYLATAASVFSHERPIATLSALMARIGSDQQELQKTFASEAEIARQLDVYADTRKRLGLPPQLPSKVELQKHPYSQNLRRIVADVAAAVGASPQKVAELVDFTRPPEQILTSLKQRREQLQETPVRVWGIETPEQFAVEYGRVNYKIPASFLATALSIALAPLLIGWIGSVYVTRQRELLLIEKLDDIRAIFPHVLNIFVGVHYGLQRQLGVSPYKRNPGGRAFDVFNRGMQALTRVAVLLLFVAPTIYCFIDSAFQLWGQFDEVVLTGLIYAGIVGSILFAQSLILVAQDAVVPFRKTFYV